MTSARSSTSGPAGTATGSSGSPSTATPGLPARRRSFRSTHSSSRGSAGCSRDTPSLPASWSHSAAGAAAFGLLYRLTLDRLGEDVARHTVLFLAVAPTSLFFGAVYSESLFLLLTVATFLAAERGRFWQAGAVGGLALLTRSAGVALVPGSTRPRLAGARPAARACRRRRDAGALPALSPAALRLDRPAVRLPRGAEGGVGASPLARWTSRRHHRRRPTREVLDLGVAVTLIVLGVVAWRRIGAAYGLYTLASVAIPLTFVSGKIPLWSMQRFADRRLPGVHGTRDDRAGSEGSGCNGDDSRRGACRVCGQMGSVVLGRMIGARC